MWRAVFGCSKRCCGVRFPTRAADALTAAIKLTQGDVVVAGGNPAACAGMHVMLDALLAQLVPLVAATTLVAGLCQHLLKDTILVRVSAANCDY
jgi:hypothetical protein